MNRTLLQWKSEVRDFTEPTKDCLILGIKHNGSVQTFRYHLNLKKWTQGHTKYQTGVHAPAAMTSDEFKQYALPMLRHWAVTDLPQDLER